MDLGLLVTHCDRTHPEASSAFSPGSFCILVLMRNTVASPTHQSSSPSCAIPRSHKRGNDDGVTAVYLFHRNGGNAIHNVSVQRLNVAILSLDLPYHGFVTHSAENLTTGKSHKKKSDGFISCSTLLN